MADQCRVAVEPVARDDADVVPGIEYVERPLGDGQLHAQLGVAAPEAADERRQRKRRQQADATTRSVPAGSRTACATDDSR